MLARLSLSVRPLPLHEVTRVREGAEAPPGDAGLSRRDIDEIWASVESLYASGLHPAIALCLRRKGRVVLDRTIGHARGNSPTPSGPKIVATPDTPFCLFSASKAITAVLVHMADERGLLHLDDPVADYVPAFAQQGKEAITLRQLMIHRAGLPSLPDAKVDEEVLTNWPKILELLCEARPLTVPGRRLAYHALTGGYLLGEVLQVVTKRSLRELLREWLTGPLGLSSMELGVPEGPIDAVAENAFTGLLPIPPLAWMLERSLGIPLRQAVEVSNRPSWLRAVVPAGNVVSTANDACKLFEALRQDGELDGVRVIDRRTLRRAVAETSYLEIDQTLGLPVRYGTGFMLGGKRLSLYGADTERAFGHLGFTNVVAWADPAREISAALLTSGKPFVTPGQVRWLNVARTIARVTAK